MTKRLLDRLLKLRNVDIDFDVSVFNAAAEHEIERNCGHIAAAVVGHRLPPIDRDYSSRPEGAARRLASKTAIWRPIRRLYAKRRFHVASRPFSSCGFPGTV